jgi:hypothetical protein
MRATFPRAAAIKEYAEQLVRTTEGKGSAGDYAAFLTGLLVGAGLCWEDRDWTKAAIDELGEAAEQSGIPGQSPEDIRRVVWGEARSIITRAQAMSEERP